MIEDRAAQPGAAAAATGDAPADTAWPSQGLAAGERQILQGQGARRGHVEVTHDGAAGVEGEPVGSRRSLDRDDAGDPEGGQSGE